MNSTEAVMDSRIVTLAETILENTKTVNQYLQIHNIPQPSFEVGGPVDIEIPPEAANVDEARIAAVEAAIELQELLQGPRQLLRPVYNATSLQALYRYKIALHVPLEGAVSFVKLSELCGLRETDLRRIIRYAIAWHRVFQEPRKGYVAHSKASRLLVDEPDMQQGLGGMFDGTWQAYAHTIEAMERFKSEEPFDTAWNMIHNTTDYHYEYISKFPEKAKGIAGTMKSHATMPGYSPQHLVEGFDWASLGGGTVVDVGGCDGHISIALATAFPSLRFIVQDYAAMIEGAEEKLPDSVRNRVTFMAHDCLTEQTVQANVFLFRWIFHDWPDAYCIRILRNLVPVLRLGDRVVICDAILAEPGTLPLLKERMARAFDMAMLSLFNSRERDEEDWRQLIENVDPNLRMVSAHVPKGSALGVIELLWEG